MEILWHLKFAETQTRPDAAFKHKDRRFPNECEICIYVISADHLQCKMKKKILLACVSLKNDKKTRNISLDPLNMMLNIGLNRLKMDKKKNK